VQDTGKAEAEAGEAEAEEEQPAKPRKERLISRLFKSRTPTSMADNKEGADNKEVLRGEGAAAEAEGAVASEAEVQEAKTTADAEVGGVQATTGKELAEAEDKMDEAEAEAEVAEAQVKMAATVAPEQPEADRAAAPVAQKSSANKTKLLGCFGLGPAPVDAAPSSKERTNSFLQCISSNGEHLKKAESVPVSNA